jgi:hypothetical protein
VNKDPDGKNEFVSILKKMTMAMVTPIELDGIAR